MEKDEDTYAALKEVASAISLSSRNDNDEIIGIEYYKNLQVLTPAELEELDQLWQQRKNTCYKERWASQLTVIQVLVLISVALAIAWLTGGMIAAVLSVIGLIGMIAMIEDKRVSVAKRNYRDAEEICARLRSFM